MSENHQASIAPEKMCIPLLCSWMKGEPFVQLWDQEPLQRHFEFVAAIATKTKIADGRAAARRQRNDVISQHGDANQPMGLRQWLHRCMKRPFRADGVFGRKCGGDEPLSIINCVWIR
ncbi:MAG: hypothetical protein R2911_15850 [Caldilineaceae bacterium]